MAARGIVLDGKVIRTLRLDQGLLQSELSHLVGCSTAFISRIESGQRAVSREILLGLAAALSVHPDVLTGVTPRPTQGVYTVDVPIIILAADSPAEIASEVMAAVVEICQRNNMEAVVRRPDQRGTMIVGRRLVSAATDPQESQAEA